jgi:beta-barrel assembly-enhancing protease
MNRHIRIRGLVAGIALAVGTTTGCGVSTQQEVQMGAEYAQQIDAQLPIVKDYAIVTYINMLGDSIASLSDDRNLDWHFNVVDAKDVNAFAVPGGYIYVNRGLIERTTNMAQLAGVLGHEIGHVTERHSIKQMQKAQTANVGVVLGCTLLKVCNTPGVGEAINVAGGALFAKFSRTDESESDAKAVQYVTRAGIHPEGIPEMFQILLNERNGSRPGDVESWFLTHPLEEDRIAHTRELVKKIDPAILELLTKDSQAYQDFKRRVQSLPPSPTPRQTPR